MNTSSQESLIFQINPKIKALEPSATLAINEQCEKMVQNNEKVFRFGFGQSPFPVPEVVVESLRKNAHQKAYLPVQGLPELREAVCGYILRTEQLTYTPSQVVVGPGTKELMFLLQSVNQAEILLPSPSWVSYAPQAEIVGRKVTWLLEEGTPDPNFIAAELESICTKNPSQPRLLILNYPENPSGRTYSKEQLEKIAQVARRFKVIILSDEIYSGLHFDGVHRSIAQYYPEGTIISNGLSKWCGAGGWRLGAFVFPQELNDIKDAMSVMASETFSAVSSPIQYASILAFEESLELTEYLRRARMILKALGNYGYEKLKAAGAELAKPQGGFYLFPSMDAMRGRLEVNDSVSLCEKLLTETGIAALPGSVFGRPQAELSMRLAYVDFDGTQAMSACEGLQTLGEGFIQTHCKATVDGFDKLSVWLQN
ncbi:MAG: aspartate aminotransferase [Patiriisocius sp.]|jgi:aspartate aminotransferase